jgi:hypothetical protein
VDGQPIPIFVPRLPLSQNKPRKEGRNPRLCGAKGLHGVKKYFCRAKKISGRDFSPAGRKKPGTFPRIFFKIFF